MYLSRLRTPDLIIKVDTFYPKLHHGLSLTVRGRLILRQNFAIGILIPAVCPFIDSVRPCKVHVFIYRTVLNPDNGNITPGERVGAFGEDGFKLPDRPLHTVWPFRLAALGVCEAEIDFPYWVQDISLFLRISVVVLIFFFLLCKSLINPRLDCRWGGGGGGAALENHLHEDWRHC